MVLKLIVVTGPVMRHVHCPWSFRGKAHHLSHYCGRCIDSSSRLCWCDGSNSGGDFEFGRGFGCTKESFLSVSWEGFAGVVSGENLALCGLELISVWDSSTISFLSGCFYFEGFSVLAGEPFYFLWEIFWFRGLSRDFIFSLFFVFVSWIWGV